MATQTFLSQLLQRLTSETPKFFKKVGIFCASLAATGIAILGFNNMHIPNTDIVIHLPEILVKISGYMIAAGTIAGSVAKMATTDADLQAKGGAIPKGAVDAVKEAKK